MEEPSFRHDQSEISARAAVRVGGRVPEGGGRVPEGAVSRLCGLVAPGGPRGIPRVADEALAAQHSMRAGERPSARPFLRPPAHEPPLGGRSLQSGAGPVPRMTTFQYVLSAIAQQAGVSFK